MDMVDLQNATLSGGVAVGAIADLMVYYSAHEKIPISNMFGWLHNYPKDENVF